MYEKNLDRRYYSRYEMIQAWVRENFNTASWEYDIPEDKDACFSITFGYQKYKFRKQADYKKFCEYVHKIDLGV